MDQVLTSGGEREEKEEQEEEEEESEREKETERVEASKTSDITPGEWLIQVFDSLLVRNQVENPRTLLLHSGVQQGTGSGRAKSAEPETAQIRQRHSASPRSRRRSPRMRSKSVSKGPNKEIAKEI